MPRRIRLVRDNTSVCNICGNNSDELLIQMLVKIMALIMTAGGTH